MIGRFSSVPIFFLMIVGFLSSGCGSGGGSIPGQSVAPAQGWWDNNYPVARQITVNGGSSGAADGAVASLPIDTRALITGGLLRPDRNDLRLVYKGGEIDRVLTDTGTILFKVQAAIPANGSDSGYYLYYGNRTESSSPRSSKANVYSFFVDGSSTAAFSIAGPPPAITGMPKPEFLKFGNNPVLRRTPGYGDWKNVRDLNTLAYDNGWYYVVYDGNDDGLSDGSPGWGAYLARSQDLSNWTKLGAILQPASSGPDSGSASGAYVTRIGSTYYMYYLGTPNIEMGVPDIPYLGMMATASAITGPYTKQGTVLPLRPSEFDCDVALINSVWYDGGRYHCLYSAAGLGYANASSPSGPWENRVRIIAGTEAVENPVLIHDPSSGYYYLFANHVQRANALSPSYTDSIVMYWSTDPTSWNTADKTTVISPDYGAWDGFVIGLLSSLVAREGVVYGGYDGRQAPSATEPMWGHEFRDGGMVEAKWPFAWGSRIHVAYGATLRSTRTFGNGTLKITAQMYGSNGSSVGLSDGSTSMLFQVDANNNFTVNNNGVIFAADFERVKGLTRTFEIRRSGPYVKYIFNGVAVPGSWTIGPTESLPISIAGNVVVESVTFEPGTLVGATALGQIGR